MRTLSGMIVVFGICIVLCGCYYSPGPWNGYNEKIYGYEPTPATIEPSPVPPVVRPVISDPGPGYTANNGSDIELTFETEPSQAVPETVTDVEIAPPAETPADRIAPDSIVETIRTIGNIDSNSTKRRMYLAIAGRGDLDDKGQVCLVNAVFDNLFSESAMEDVLITLIRNPNFSNAGRDAISARADDFFSDSSKTRILSTLQSK